MGAALTLRRAPATLLSMILITALLLQASALEPARIEWLARPNARDMAECLSGSPKAVVVTLQCRTASNDKLKDCTASTMPADPKAEKSAICAAKKFRVRATDAAGAVLIGAPVTTGFRLGSP